jgi:7-carboxy-7-deazaguanine synthase
MLKINEIFHSIQGESTLVGLATVFVRTSGCHLRCHYCDTQYAYYDGKQMSVEDIVDKVKSFGAQNVCITGGEPLLQKDIHLLMSRLCDAKYQVSLETSGDLQCDLVDPRVRKIIDIKTPDSGEGQAFDPENLKLSGVNTEFKFVICSESDFLWAENFVAQHLADSASVILYSPSFGAVQPQWLAEKILHSKSSARLQLQLHKYIWSPDQRGV